MFQNLLAELSQLVDSSEDIRLDEIPEYHLYISQLEEFLDKKLGKTNSNDEERKAISKTMIQNYIKDGLLLPPDGKSYDRSHIIFLILIYSLKSILSIRDIRKLFNPILTDISEGGEYSEIDQIYENYLELKQSSVKKLNSELTLLMNQVKEKSIPGNKMPDEQDHLRLVLLISTLITEANLRKQVAEFLIEKYL